jgi:hypothetical protein
MAVWTGLNAEIMTSAVPVPKAAQVPAAATAPRRTKPGPCGQACTLQVRWPAADVKATKLTAIQRDFPTGSNFMRTCFHAYMEASQMP